MRRTFEYKNNSVEIRFVVTKSATGRGFDTVGTHEFDGKLTPIAVRWGMGSFGFFTPGDYADLLLDAEYSPEGQTTVVVLESKLEGVSVGDILKFELIKNS